MAPAAVGGILVDEYIEIYSDEDEGYDYDNNYSSARGYTLDQDYGDEPNYGRYSPESERSSFGSQSGGWVEYLT
jgi:hypothetical protein